MIPTEHPDLGQVAIHCMQQVIAKRKREPADQHVSIYTNGA